MRSLFPRVAFLTNAFGGQCGVHTLFVLERQLGVWVHTTTSSKQRALDALAEHVAGRACTQSVLAAARAELRVSYKDKSEVVAMRDRARSLVVLRDTVVRFNSNYSAEILPREAAVANAFVYSNETVQASLGPFWVELQPELADILDDLLGSDLDVFLHWLCSILAGEKLEIIIVIFSIARSTGKSLLLAFLHFVFGDRMAGAVSANGQLFLKGLAMGATAERQFNANIAQSLVYCLDDARPGSINFDALKPMQSPTGGCVAPQGTGKSLKCRMCPGFAATTNNAPESLFTEPWTVLDNVITIGFGASEERQERRLKACKWLEQHLDPAAGVETHEALRRDFVVMLLQFVNKAQDPATKAAIAQRMHHLKLRQYLGGQAAERNAATAAAVATSTVDDATRVKEWLEEGCRITHIRPEDRRRVQPEQLLCRTQGQAVVCRLCAGGHLVLHCLCEALREPAGAREIGLRRGSCEHLVVGALHEALLQVDCEAHGAAGERLCRQHLQLAMELSGAVLDQQVQQIQPRHVVLRR